MARYCGRECQRIDWKKHRVECHLLKGVKGEYNALPGADDNRLMKLHFFLSKALMQLDSMDPETRKKEKLPTDAQLKTFQKDRLLKFVTYSRVCSICLKNQFTDCSDEADWKCCDECNYGWCCSAEHWEQYKEHHTKEICDTYKKVTAMELFHYRHIKKFDAAFLETPTGSLSVLLDSFPNSWDSYFRLRFVERYPSSLPMLPSEYYPAATRQLSQPATCLHAMYKYGISHFQDLTELTVHVVGAGAYELPASCIWEEITHCLPNVKRLSVEFIGPEVCLIIPHKELPTIPIDQVCPDCTIKGRQRCYGMYGYTYHDYQEKEDAVRPDFIVAFNSGMHEAETESWKTSLEMVLDMNVPAYFTSYEESEAIKDFDLLMSLGANILQDKIKLNPFSDQQVCIEPVTVGRMDKFFSPNMYGVLFCGREE
ncbi:MAG: hypothetical protein SGILL_008475 [Bacillariaceae sp.]